MLRPRRSVWRRMLREIVRQLAGDERSRSTARVEIPFSQQLFVRRQRRRPRYVEIFGEGARRWQARAGRDDSIKDVATDPAIDLLLQPFVRASIDPNQEARGRWAWEMVTCIERHRSLNYVGLHVCPSSSPTVRTRNRAIETSHRRGRTISLW